MQALILRADQEAFRTVEVHDTGRRTVNTHFVLDRTAGHVVRLAITTIVVHIQLRHDKQRDTFCACRRIRKTGKYDMNNVVGKVVFTRRNKNLSPGDVVATISILSAAARSSDWPR